MGRIPTANKRNFSTRVEEIAPNVVLMSLAITVILITAGIVFVLFESGSKFFTGFACGVDDFNPPQDWSQELNDDIESHAIYSEGSLSDPFYLDRYCVVDWNMEGMVGLSHPLIVYDEDLGRWVLSQVNDRNQWLNAYFEGDIENRAPPDLDGDGYPNWEEASIPLSLLNDNENALRLQAMTYDSNIGLDRSWVDITWIGSDEGRMHPVDFFNEDLNNDGAPDWSEDRALVLIPDLSFCLKGNLFWGERTSKLLDQHLAEILVAHFNSEGSSNPDSFDRENQTKGCLYAEDMSGIEHSNVRYSSNGKIKDLGPEVLNEELATFYVDLGTQSIFELKNRENNLSNLQQLAKEITFPYGLSTTSEWSEWISKVQILIDNDELVRVSSSDLPWDYDHDGNRDVGKNAYGSDADSDIDNDGITNYKDDDLDSDGLPNHIDPDPRIPNVDIVGILLGVLTLIVVSLTFTAHRYLPKLATQSVDSFSSGVNSTSLLVLLIAVPSMLTPPSIQLLLVISALFLVPAISILVISNRRAVSLFCMGATALAFALFPVHGVQTGHTLALGLALVAWSSALRDPRNQAGEPSNGKPLFGKLKGNSSNLPGETGAFLAIATISTLILCVFDFTARVEGSIGEFLTQVWWKTDVRGVVEVTTSPDVHMGVNSLLQTTLQVAFGALFVAIPLGLGTAVYLSEYAKPRTANIIKPVLELLAGIPSVVYGFFAFIVISPLVVELGEYLLERGYLAEPPQIFNPLNGAIVVGIMITPLIASLSEDALRAVPDNLRQASYALGATPTETTMRVTIPSALSGILASIILALSRAVGETMAVTLSVGTIATFSDNMFISARTMTAYIAQRVQGELPSGTTPYFSLFAVGLYLFVITLGLNLLGQRVMNRYREAYE